MSLTPVTPTVKTLPIHSKAALGQSGKLSTPDVKFGINPFDILEGGQQFYEKNDKIQQLRRKGHIKRWGLYNAVIAFVAGPLGYFAPQLIDTLQDYQDHREKIDLISTIEGDANDPLTWTEDDRVIVDTAKLVQNRDQLTSEKFTQLIDMGWGA